MKICPGSMAIVITQEIVAIMVITNLKRKKKKEMTGKIGKVGIATVPEAKERET